MKLIVSLAGALLLLSLIEANPIIVPVTNLPSEVENRLANIAIDAQTINYLTIIVAEVVNINNDGSTDTENPITTTPPQSGTTLPGTVTPPTTTPVLPGTTTLGTTIGTPTPGITPTTPGGGPIITLPTIGRK